MLTQPITAQGVFLHILLGLTVIFSLSLTLLSSNGHAAATLVSSGSNTGSTTTTSTTLSAVTAGNLMVVICSAKNNTTMSVNTPSGFTTAITQSGTPSQAIYYKVSVGGETTFTCTFGTAGQNGIQVFEYRGITTPVSGVLVSSATGTGTAYATGTVNTVNAYSLVIGAYIVNTGNSSSTWSNSFTQALSGGVSSGNQNNRYQFASATRSTTATGSYTTTATGFGSAAWRGQIVSFIEVPPTLSINVVNASGVTVPSPSVALSSTTTAYSCQTTAGTLGTSAQRLRITNTTANPSWTVSIAATSGGGAVWTNGSDTYAYNNASGAGCTAGQLSVTGSGATISPQSGCSSTGLSLSDGAFSNPSQNTLTLVSASGSSQVGCYWDITGAALSQFIPAEQPAGNYSLGLTITVVAN
jgi:hypothetical protein